MEKNMILFWIFFIGTYFILLKVFHYVEFNFFPYLYHLSFIISIIVVLPLSALVAKLLTGFFFPDNDV